MSLSQRKPLAALVAATATLALALPVASATAATPVPVPTPNVPTITIPAIPAIPTVDLGGVLGPGSVTCQFLNGQLQLTQQAGNSLNTLLANAYSEVLGLLGCGAPAAK
ncbi:MAG: hypothetical protein JWO17_2324 [Actinomycetia bacterium]|nr:hypothetical protein [Actinomycetes bacterium]